MTKSAHWKNTRLNLSKFAPSWLNVLLEMYCEDTTVALIVYFQGYFFSINRESSRRERALTLHAHEQPCLFVLRDWKWRRAETKAITWVCKRECAVIETRRPHASGSWSYLGFATADGTRVGGDGSGFFATRFGFSGLL